MIKNESFIEEKVIDNIYPQRISFYKTKYSLNHRSIGLLRFIDQNNTQYLGTAFLISSNLILTAAHNVYDKQKKNQYQDFKFYLSPYGEVQVSNYYQIQLFRIPQEYKTCPKQQKNPYDYALMKLKFNQNLPIKYNKFCELFYLCQSCPISQDYKQWQLQIYGYTKIEHDDGIRLESYQKGLKGDKTILEINVKNHIIKYQLSTIPGHSGSPVIWQGSILAIHICSQKHEKYNAGRLITTDLLSNLQKWSIQMNSNPFTINPQTLCPHYKPIKKQDIKNNQIKSQQILQQIINLKDKGMKQYINQQYSNALIQYCKCLSLQQQYFNKNHIEISQTYRWIGTIFWTQQKYNQAIQNFKKQIEILEYNNCQNDKLWRALWSLGDIYKNKQKNYQQSKKYFEKSLKLSKDLNNNKWIQQSKNSLKQCLPLTKNNQSLQSILYKYKINT